VTYLPPAERPKWQQSAACRGKTEMFFPDRTATHQDVRDAKRICAACPVRAECREYGLTSRWGIWGGLDEKERRELKRQRRHGRGAA